MHDDEAVAMQHRLTERPFRRVTRILGPVDSDHNSKRRLASHSVVLPETRRDISTPALDTVRARSRFPSAKTGYPPRSAHFEEAR